MKKFWIFYFLFVLLVAPVHARDFIVEFVEENYKETQEQFSYDPLIYHSIQVNSSAGPKILVLTGTDYNYRKWLRHYIAEDKKFITRIDDDRIDEFISSKAYAIDVRLIHPFNGDKWDTLQMQPIQKSGVQGDNNILIVDPNEKRSHLIMTVVKKMGYGAVIFSSARKALEAFSLEPEKFKMVMVHHSIEEMRPKEFVTQVIKTDHTIPVVIDIGYKNQAVKNELSAWFSEEKSVYLAPVILRELSKTIENLMKKSV